jgi:glutaconyl-CoA decarboxylase
MSKFNLDVIGKSFEIVLKKDPIKGYTVSINGKDYDAKIEDYSESSIRIAVGQILYFVELQGEPSSSKLVTIVNDRKRIIESPDLFGGKIKAPGKSSIKTKSTDSATPQQASEERSTGLSGGIMAPMPGKVVMVNKKVGDAVEVGDVVLILEAMKMENEITSDKEGKVTEIRIKEGDSVDAHDVLVVVG